VVEEKARVAKAMYVIHQF